MKYIYIIINKVNKKFYVGKTEVNVNKRFRQHISMLNRNQHTNKYLQKDWNKYEENSFEFKVIREFSDTLTSEELLLIEKKLIERFKSKFTIYNIGNGGEGGMRKLFSHTVVKCGLSTNGKQMFQIKNNRNRTLISSIDKEKLEVIADLLNNNDKYIIKTQGKNYILNKQLLKNEGYL